MPRRGLSVITNQPGPGELAAEPVLVAVGAVGHKRAEAEPRRLGPHRQARADHQLGADPGSFLPPREVPRRGVGHRGTDYITTPIRKPQCRKLLQWEQEWNAQVSSFRAPIERQSLP